MTSGRLNEMISTDIFDMRLTEESLAIKSPKQKVESIEEKAETAAGFRYFNYRCSQCSESPISFF